MAFGKFKRLSATRVAIATAAIAVSIGVVGPAGTESRAQTSGVSAIVVKAASACFASAVRFTGLVVPRAEAVVNFNADGYEITEVLASEGDTVTAGQALVKLTRLSNGAATGSAGAQQQTAGATGGSAQQQQPSVMTLTAPAAGVVSKSTAKVGAVAAPVPLPPPMGTGPLFRIIVDNKLEIEAEVTSVDLPKLEAGQPGRARLENGRDVSGKIRTIMPEIDPNTQLGKVRLTLDSDQATRAGMFATGTIDASRRCGVVSIPRSAVQYRTEGATVQVVRNDTVQTRQVRLGFFTDNDIEVQDGVKEGELVIANAGTSLHDGDQVKPMFADDISQPGAR
jgi:multidrug efflux pump subunit AcrA (membrane-fusion protein)